MPLPSTFAGASARSEGEFLGSYGPPPIAGPYFINVEVPVPDQTGTFGMSDQVHATCVDSSGNIYTTSIGWVTGSASCVTVSKYNSSGVVQWATGFNVTNSVSSVGGAFPLPYYMAVDSSGTVYAQYYFVPQGTGISTCYVAKFNGSTGSLITCLNVGTPVLGYVDLSGNMYFYDNVSNGNGGYNAVLYKYNSSNSCVWKSVYYSSSGQASSTSQISGCVVDSSGNIYLSMQGTSVNTNLMSYIAKLDSSGQSVWEVKVGANTYGIALDNSGNIFVASNFVPSGGASVNGYTSKGLILSYTNSGAFRWGWYGQSPTWFDGCTLFTVATDSSGNVFVGGVANSASFASNGGVVAKFNNSGTLLTSGSLYGSASSSSNDTESNGIRTVVVDRSGNTYWVGAVQSNKATSGSKTTYNVAEGILIKDTNSIMSTHSGSFTVNSNVTANWTTGTTNNNMAFSGTGTLNSSVAGTSFTYVIYPSGTLSTVSAIFGNALTNTNGSYSTGPGISNYKVTI